MKTRFLGSFMASSLPDLRLPEFAIAGRSNVGKSALINTVVGNRKIARVSSTPGATRSLNLYLCDDRFILTDLPGYGYSKVHDLLRQRWSKEIETYFRSRQNLSGCILVLDVRHFPLRIDIDALNWLCSFEIEVLLVFTKCDKISRSQLLLQKAQIEKTLSEQSIVSQYVMFSARTGLGRKEVLSWIEKKIGSYCSSRLVQ